LFDVVAHETAGIKRWRDQAALREHVTDDVQRDRPDQARAVVGPLEGLTGLQFLGLSGTQVADFRALKGLPALNTLYLRKTQFADLGQLKGLTVLRELYLNGTQVTDLEPLKGLTELQTLDLSNTQVMDLAPVQDLPNLTKITGASDVERQRFDAYRAKKGLPILSKPLF
jgi:hypothetical protein